MNDLAPAAGRAAVLALHVVACAASLACAACTAAPAHAPTTPHSEAPAPDLAAHADLADLAAPAAPRRPLPGDASCPLAWEPREVGSVLRVPADVMARPMRSVVDAACRCVHPGEDVRVVAAIDLTAGQVVADAPDAPDVAGCLDQVTLPAFEPWGAGVASDCIDCGPRRYGVFGAGPRDEAHAEAARLRVQVPLRVDRRAP